MDEACRIMKGTYNVSFKFHGRNKTKEVVFINVMTVYLTVTLTILLILTWLLESYLF
jgi:hypothetical protein